MFRDNKVTVYTEEEYAKVRDFREKSAELKKLREIKSLLEDRVNAGAHVEDQEKKFIESINKIDAAYTFAKMYKHANTLGFDKEQLDKDPIGSKIGIRGMNFLVSTVGYFTGNISAKMALSLAEFREKLKTHMEGSGFRFAAKLK